MTLLYSALNREQTIHAYPTLWSYRICAFLILLILSVCFGLKGMAQGPVITYTPLVNTCQLGERTLVATITSPNGVPTAGVGLPVLYWRLNSGLYTPVQAVSLGNNQYSFSFGGIATSGSVVSYFIVAQTNASTPEVSVYPSTGASGFTIDPPGVSEPPVSPDFYLIQPTLSAGTYLVGSAPTATFPTITSAIETYNNACLNGPVVFALTDAAYSTNEIFPISISNPAASAINTLTIRPNTGINTTITANAESIFKLVGADYITINGSNNNTTSRNLTLQNNSISPLSTVVWLSSFGSNNGSSNNVVRNCNVYGFSPSTTFSAITVSSGVATNLQSDAPNNYNSFINNNINNCYQGFYLNGPVAGDTANVFTSNVIGTATAARKLGYRSINLINQRLFNIQGNTISGLSSVFGTGSEVDASGGVFVAGNSSDGNIQGNFINDIRNTSNTGAASFGICMQSSVDSARIRIFNNFIHTITGIGKPLSVLENGIGVVLLSGGSYQFVNNSINLATNQTVSGITSCMYVGASVVGGVDIRNNIFSNRNSLGVRYAIYIAASISKINAINYNDYFSSGVLGFLLGNKLNLAAWQAATTSDGNSVVQNPIFVSVTDLHLQNTSPLNDQGQAIGFVTVDIDNVTRSATAPDIGADEFTPPLCSEPITGGTASNTASSFLCVNGSMVLSGINFSVGSGMAYQWQISVDSLSWSDVPGETNPISANTPIISQTSFFRLRAACSGGTPAYSNVVKVNVKNPGVSSTVPGFRCGNGALTLSATPTNTETTLSWYSTNSGGVALATGGTYTTPAISTTTTYYVEPSFVGSTSSCGPARPTAVSSASVSYQLASHSVIFDVLNTTTLYSVDVFPQFVGFSFSVDLYNAENELLATTSFVTSVSGGATAQTVPINAFLRPGTGYYLFIRFQEDNTQWPCGLNRNIANAVYPYNSADASITGNSFDNTFFMCLYNWRFLNGCTVDRIPVDATIGTPADFTFNGQTNICLGGNTNITTSSTNSNYSYAWSPGGLSGSAVTLAPTVNTTYTVTATDGTCTNVKQLIVTVNEAPSAVSIANNAPNPFCNGSTVTLIASGGTIPSLVTILNERFEDNGLPQGWVITNSGPLVGRWTQQTSTYIYGGYAFRSNDNSKFFLANSTAAGNVNLNTILRTPRLDFTGYDSASISFWHHYSPFIQDSIQVERSRDLSTWTPIYRAGPTVVPSAVSTVTSNAIGTGTGFVRRVIDLTPYLRSVPTATRDTFYLRFRFGSKDGFWWAIDNVLITGKGGSPITWSPTTGLFDNVACTNPYNPSIFSPVVYTKPTSQVTYTALSGTPNGCSSSASVTLNPRPAVTSDISGVDTICPGTNVSLSISFTGIAPWRFTVRNVTTGTNFTTITTSSNPHIFNVGVLNTTSVFKVTTLKDSNNLGCSPTTAFLNADSVKVNVRPVGATLSGTQTICAGSTASLSVSLIGSPPWNFSYSNGSVTTAVTGVASSPYTLPVSPSQNTTYSVNGLSDGNGCTSLVSNITGTASITIRDSIRGALTGSAAICEQGTASLTATLSGSPPWSFTYLENGANSVTITNVNSSPHIFNVSPLSNTSYTLGTITDGNGCQSFPQTVQSNADITINFSPTTTWTGSNSNWFDPSNWCGGVPTLSKNVRIPGGITNYPVIAGSTATAKNVIVESGAALTIQSTGRIDITGTTENSGILTNLGLIRLSGPLAQEFPGGTNGLITKMNILEVDKTGSGTDGTMIFNRKFSMTDTGVLRLMRATVVQVQDTITIRSSSSGTARIDKVGNGVTIDYTGLGCFTVERYFPTGVVHGKSWQMLSTPTIGQTVRQAWQEGANGVGNNPRPGYGTTITSNLTGATASLGFDFFTPSGGTMRVYDAATNTYVGVPNTLTTPVNNPKGYMFFVRGDRSVLTSSAPANEVVLRTTGRIFYGAGVDSAVSIQVPAGKFQSIGNPYASPIDFTKLLSASNGINPTFYVWDPTLQSGNGLGAFQTISSFSGWQAIPGGTVNYPTSLVNARIQSGQAFFVYSGSGGRVRFNEQVKTDGYRSVLRQPAAEPITLKSTLFDGQGRLLDGHLLAIDPAGMNDEDEFDAPKPNNMGENVGLENGSRVLSLDVREQISETDTIRLRIWNMKTQSYRLAFCPQRWAGLGLQPILGDRFTGSSTVIGITDSTFYPFNVVTDPASRSEGRFYIYFRGLRPLPVQFVDVKATKRGQDAFIEWKVGEESNITHYDVERSSDGMRFSKIGEMASGSNNKNYAFTDVDPVAGINFYRIRAVSPTELPRYSKIVTVDFDNQQSGFAMYPNPVTDKQVTLTTPVGLSGVFVLQLFDNQGKKIQSMQISISGNDIQYRLMIGKNVAFGSYRVVLQDAWGVTRYTTWLIVE